MRRLRGEREAPASRRAPAAPLIGFVARGDEADLAAVEAIAHECFGEAFSVEEELARSWSRVWATRLAPGEPPVAFLVAWHVADELHVLNIATTTALRRRGLALALMDEALAYAAEHHMRIVLLEVRRSNRAAIKLYRGLGFTALGVRPKYYADNDEDAIEMILGLDPESGARLPGRDEIRIDG
jgi:ribosomal-protein-alanine N-acetyltransferase